MLARIQPHAITLHGPTVDEGTVTPIASAPRHPKALSPMLARLTLETKRHHAPIEELLLDAIASPSVSSYRHLLARLYGFDAPLASRLLSTTGLDASFLVPRIRAAWIASDLLGLGLSRAEGAMLLRRHEIPAFSSGAQALGWLYVSERVTLRHDLIRAKIRSAIPEVLETAGDYLGSTQHRAQHGWAGLGAALDRAAYCEIAAQEIIKGAHAAFESQHAWLASTPFDGF
ncbi:MAG: putative Heme oxygenase [Myxococcales bacterium]|nr:putative Heme oxygenase [Myxococcales bacterium]